MYFGICKERTAFILVSLQVGMYVMTGLMFDSKGTDGAPIARILTFCQVLQGWRCYPHNINIKCNLLFSEHIQRKGHMKKTNKQTNKKKQQQRFIKNSSLKTNLFLDRKSN